MIIKQHIKDFENLGMGMFVHFGLYSIWGKGEWYYSTLPRDGEERSQYQALANEFNPEKEGNQSVCIGAYCGDEEDTTYYEPYFTAERISDHE